jgi:hypothetical protein
VTEEQYFSEGTGKVSIGTPREQFKKSQKFKVSLLVIFLCSGTVFRIRTGTYSTVPSKQQKWSLIRNTPQGFGKVCRRTLLSIKFFEIIEPSGLNI